MSLAYEAVEAQIKAIRAVSSLQSRTHANEKGDAAAAAQLHHLKNADTVYVTKDILSVIASMVETLPSFSLGSVAPELKNCFIFFGTPVVLCSEPHQHDKDCPIFDGISYYHDYWSGPKEFKEAEEGLVFFRYRMTEHPSFWFASGPLRWAWYEGEYVEDYHWQNGFLFSPGEYMRRFVLSLFAFLKQPFVSEHQEQSPRHLRRRIEREGGFRPDPIIRTIALRRREHSGSEHHEGEGRDYSCQWIVSGHWRNQYYASTKTHKPVWILPYVKGPEDKPLKKPRLTVYGVTR